MYKLIGTDGREYGPVTAEQVRQWIRENRVERQTRVLVSGATDWTIVGMLPEFVNDFPGIGAPPPPAGPPPLIQAPRPAFVAPVYSMPSDSMAKAALVCGIVSVTCCCCTGMPFNLLGIIFAVIALGQIAGNPQRYGGAVMAIVGLVLSLCSFLYLAVAVLSH